MRNKRGDLLKNVLALIIAVVGISLIIFAAVKLYSVNIEQDSENAKKLLSAIEGKIKNLKDGEIGRFPIRGIEEWILVGWDKDDIGRPDKCFFDSCICVCKGNGEDAKDSCQGKDGFCKKIDKKVSVIGYKTYKKGAIGEGIPLPYPSETLSERVNYLILQNNLIELEIHKTSSEVIISKNG